MVRCKEDKTNTVSMDVRKNMWKNSVLLYEHVEKCGVDKNEMV